MAGEIVIGIDFGTTHTGVSWTYGTAAVDDIDIVNDWHDPSRTNANHDKLPSEIIYDENGRPVLFGFDARNNVATTSIRWFKVLMDPDHMQDGLDKEIILNNTQQILATIGKTADEVVIDYLRYVWKWTIQTIQASHQKRIEEAYRFRIVVTVPAIWDAQARERTCHAIKAIVADLAWPIEPIEIVQEPAAAAIYTLYYMMKRASHEIRTDDCYLVCDAGGGTVDLMAFEVKGVKPLEIEPIVEASGSVCGSFLLDRSFYHQMRKSIGERRFSDFSPQRTKRMMNSFEDYVKQAFRYDTPADELFRLDLEGVKVGEDLVVINGYVHLSCHQLRAIFEPVCQQIWFLIRDHIREVQREGKDIKAVLLVGGFGMSDFLEGFIQAKCPSKIKVIRTRNNITAVCKGATMLGVERAKASQNPGHRYPVTPEKSLCSYGVISTEPDGWDERIHRSLEYVKHPVTGEKVIKNQMKWLLKYGDRIDPDRIEKMIISNFVRVAHKKIDILELFPEDVTFETKLFYCRGPEVPTQLSYKCILLRTLKVTLKGRRVRRRESRVFSTTTGEIFYKVTYNLQLKFGNSQLTFELTHADKEFSVEPVELEDDMAQGPALRRSQQSKGRSETVTQTYVYQNDG